MIEALPDCGPVTGPIAAPTLDPCDGIAGLTHRELMAVLRERHAALVAADAALAATVAAVGDAWGMDPDDEWVPDDPREERFRSGPDGMPGFWRIRRRRGRADPADVAGVG